MEESTEQQRARLELVVNMPCASRDAEYKNDLLEQSEAAAELKAMKNLLSAIVDRCNQEGFVHQPALARVPIQCDNQSKRHLKPL
jgi:hypothetical protein